MTQAPAAIFKIPTKSPQLTRGKAARPAARAKTGRPATGRVLANGAGRTATRGGGEVIELECGITVYPAREEKGRWRAVWREDGKRQQCEASSEEKLAARLEKVTDRLAADAGRLGLRLTMTHRTSTGAGNTLIGAMPGDSRETTMTIKARRPLRAKGRDWPWPRHLAPVR